MLTLKEFQFEVKPWKPTGSEIPAKGPLARLVLSMKVGDEKVVTKDRCKGMRDAAFRRSIPHRVEKVNANRWKFVRTG